MIDKVLTRIRLERFRNGFSQQFVAGELKISQSYYAKIESGKNTLTVKYCSGFLKFLKYNRKN